MQIFRAFGLFLVCAAFFAQPSTAQTIRSEKPPVKANLDPRAIVETPVAQQQLVEAVDIQGNRRLKDEDLLYYIKTRPGDVFNAAQLERDLRELLALNFFDKASTRVLTEEGVRGGVNVIFEVKELPIIRDLQFEGAKAIQESDILKEFREKRVGISKENIYNPVNAQKAVRVLREMLASKGYPNAKVTIKEEDVSATSKAITFQIVQGYLSRIVKIEFEGNEKFKDGELRSALQYVHTGIISRFKSQDILDSRKLQFDLQKNVRDYMRSRGYLEARIGEPQIEGLGFKRTGLPILRNFPLPLLTSKDDTLKIIVPITEGRLFRVGKIKVDGNSIFSEDQIRAIIGLKEGDIADGKRFSDALFEELKKYYGSQGFVNYEAEPDTETRENPKNPKEGIADFTVAITEGKQFTLRRLEFQGNTFTRDKVLRREVLINEGDIYNQQSLEFSVLRLNQTQYFDPIDKDKDVETRTDEENGTVDMLIKVKEKGRQQISFNGGISGIGGTSFGLQYSTNNLFGRGENFSLDAGLGNRQTSFQLSFTEPYFRNRPITIGFSLFASRYKYFGEGTSLSNNTDLILGSFDPRGRLLTNSDNLFTQNTYGFSFFATSSLSEFLPKRKFTQFSRVGLTYQLSATSIKDPPVNSANNQATLIPVVFRQPNIITSQITPSFVYDTRQPSANGIDTNRGKQLSVSFALAGLGGDVRTYQPSVTYLDFIPVRRKRSRNPEVFGFRLTAGTIGAFGTSQKIRNANSFSFIGGVPFSSRYFLGDESTIRGYDVRSISPIAPVDTYVTSRNVTVATNQSGTAVPISDARVLAELAPLGIFTGANSGNSALIQRSFNYIGGDTQLLGNFEYRIPIFGPASFAFFGDIGTTFNLRKPGTQSINSEFLRDEQILGQNDLSVIFLRNNPQFQPANQFIGGLLLRDQRPITRLEYTSAIIDPNTGLPINAQAVFLRGEAQTNTLIKINDAQFNKIGNYRSSVGVEFRVQVPIVNVPFRLIYFINPNSRFGFYESVPGFFFSEKKRGFRFSVGRTF